MKLLNVAVLSTFVLVGLYLGAYSLLYKLKVKEAQRETSILTPPKLFQFLNSVIIISFSTSLACVIFILIEIVKK